MTIFSRAFAVGAAWLSLTTLAQAQPRTATPATADPGNVVVRSWNGRPTIYRDDVPLLMPAYCNSILGWGQPQQEARWKSWVDNFIRSGVKIYHLELGRYKGQYGQSSFWTGEDEYSDAPHDEPMSTDKRAEYILSKVPDALFIIRPHTYAPTAWIQANPGELQTDSAGEMYQPSWASEKYLEGLKQFLTRVVKYHESRPWHNRILGYEVIPLGEGYSMLGIAGHFYDRSAAMQKAWRSYLAKKYSDDTTLRKAWNNEAVSLQSVEIPDDASLRAKVEHLPQWPEASQMRVERDYALLQKELHARWLRTVIHCIKDAAQQRSVLIGIDAMKEPLLGWQIQEAFEGGGRSTQSFSMYLASGSFGLGPLMDMPELTNLITPADYTARGMGNGYEAEGAGDSMVLRGKTLFIENDVRTFLTGELPDGRFAAGTFNDIAQVRAGLLRNTSLALSRGFLPYWTDIANAGSFYGSEPVQLEIRRDKTLLENGERWPHRETEHAIAVIIDDSSPLYENFTNGFQQLAVLRQRVEGLALCGIPYRLYLLSDLDKPNFPNYRCYYFPNLFRVNDEVLDLLKRKVFKDGHMAIFGPGTGITDGETVSAAGAEKVVGIPMRLTKASSSRRVRLNGSDLGLLKANDLPAFYGDSFMYGPILTPEPERLANSGAKVLGDLVSTWSVNAPGLVVKEFGRGAARDAKASTRGTGDYAVAFSAALPLPPPLLRALAAYGGCNVWCNRDVVLTASDTIVSLHSTQSGPYTIHLPRRYRRVMDAVTGQTVGRDLQELRIKLQPPQTRTFLLE